MTTFVSEEDVEEFAFDVLTGLGYERAYGPDISEGGLSPERKYNEVVLLRRLRRAIDRLNPSIPSEAKGEAIKKVLRETSQNLVENNHTFHKMLVDGVDVEYRKNGRIIGDKVWLIDFDNVENNEFLAVNQFTVIEGNNNRRPDIVLFVNGLPLVVIELKNPADKEATIWKAYGDHQTKMQEIPSLFHFNEILIISDGTEARTGTITSDKQRFMPWKTIDGEEPSLPLPQLEVLIKGICKKETLLDIIRHFIVFEKGGKTVRKIMAAYHQYNAVNKALESTLKARRRDKKAGVVWHTQGSGKSLIMAFYAGKLVLEPEMENPTIVVLTDRNDLDDQLFDTFSRCHEILRQKPVQAETREDLKKLLKVASGGVIFTTIQKFFPEENREEYPLLSDRDNIVVIADEAHRSQYGFKAKVIRNEDEALITYGYAKYVRDALPNASFIGFTGTPIEQADKSTPAVFGNYVDIYDIEQAIKDGATVPIYYESRLAKLELKPEERPKIDEEFEEVTEGEEIEKKERLKSKWAQLEKVVGAPSRIKKIAGDIVEHFENRLSVIDGKGMIVCMSRRICVELYNEIIKLRPEWHSEDDDSGFIKIVMTGSASDPKEWQQHIRNKKRRKELGEKFKDPQHPFKLVIVRDMWLTGFDVPSLHTMYVDKPMKGHTLMQAIARVNRVYKDKKGGLIVDYIGLGFELKKALADYTVSGGRGKPTIDQDEAVAIMLEKYEIVQSMFHGFAYKQFFELEAKERISFIPKAMEHILQQEDGKERYIRHVTALIRAFSLAVPHEKAMEIKEEVGFFQAIKNALVKNTSTKMRYQEELDSAIKQILSKAIISDRVIDIFAAAGLKKPDISILSDEFLEEVRGMPEKNLAFEALKKLLNDEIKIKMKKNIVQARSFREMLERTIRRYTNRTIEAAQVVEELIELAKKMRKSDERTKEMGLTEAEIAFYDALADNESARIVLGDKILRRIAIEITEKIRKNVTIDWTLRESVQAKLRVIVKKTLRKYDYPPDKREEATALVLEQAKLIAKDWAENKA
ncbi:MAG TPA: type I restriction endonuclease subunit R [Thermoplasmata archaeon]|nr:type I restriction endonuclease subunit R [Thermoplasmata archaeon]